MWASFSSVSFFFFSTMSVLWIAQFMGCSSVTIPDTQCSIAIKAIEVL